MFLVCHLKYNNNLIILFFKKIKTEPFLKQHPNKMFQIFLNKLFQKWNIFFSDDDESDEFKKTETISIKQPCIDDRNDFVIIPGNEKGNIKSLFKTDIQTKNNFKWKKQKNRKPYRKLIKKENLLRYIFG